jgi:hypothetical protein
MRSALMHIIRWRSARDTHGTYERVSFADFAETLKVPFVCPTKKDLPAFSPIKLEGTRKDENVQLISMAVLDYDAGIISLDEATRAFSRFHGAIYPTFSHEPGKPKYRILLPFRSPLPPSECRQMLKKLIVWGRSFGMKFDETTLNPSRLWFLPGAPNAEQTFELVILPGTTMVSLEAIPTTQASSTLERILALVTNAPEGSRNDALNRAGYALGKAAKEGLVDGEEGFEQLRSPRSRSRNDAPQWVRCWKAGRRAGARALGGSGRV